MKKNRHVVVTDSANGDSRSYLIPFGSRVIVNEGDVIQAGARITEGSVNPHDVLAISGPDAVQDYLIEEVQRVYRMQGVDINDKHIEVIVRQMMKKVRVEDAGDTTLLPSSLVEKSELLAENLKIRERIAAGETGFEGSHLHTCPSRYHKGIASYRFLPFRRFLPGNHSCSDRCRYQGQGRSVAWPERKCYHRQACSCRNWYAVLQQRRCGIKGKRRLDKRGRLRL